MQQQYSMAISRFNWKEVGRMWTMVVAYRNYFFALTHPIHLYHRDDIYYMVLSTVLFHIIMVKEQFGNDEEEDDAFYSTITDSNIDDTQVDNTTEVDIRKDYGYNKILFIVERKSILFIGDGRS